MAIALQELMVDQVTGQTSGQTSGTPFYIQDASGIFVQIGTIATGGAIIPITPTPTDLMTRNEIKGLVTLSIDTALADNDKRFLKMESKFKDFKKEILQQLKGNRGNMVIDMSRSISDNEAEIVIEKYLTQLKKKGIKTVNILDIIVQTNLPSEQIEKVMTKLKKKGVKSID